MVRGGQTWSSTGWNLNISQMTDPTSHIVSLQELQSTIVTLHVQIHFRSLRSRTAREQGVLQQPPRQHRIIRECATSVPFGDFHSTGRDRR